MGEGSGMAEQRERWSVQLEVRSPTLGTVRPLVQVTIGPPFGIRCADAEVCAIKNAEAAESGCDARALRSWFEGYEP